MTENEAFSGYQMKNAYAVIIGIGKYKDPAIPALNYTHNDAQSIHNLLINPDRIGMPAENIKLLLDEAATLLNIKSAVGTWLQRNADEDSTVMVFFSGHGGADPDVSGSQTHYLLPWDAQKDDLYASAISSRDFEGMLQRIRSNRLVMFLDACHSGGLVSREGIKDVATVENLCTELATGSGRAIITASKGSQQSFEDKELEHGIFAYHLIEALNGKADADSDGKITLTEVFNYLAREVPATARRLAGALQEPMMRSELNRDLVLAINKEKLETIRKEAERSAQENKKIEEKKKLYDWWCDGKLVSAHYDKAVSVYEADDATLDESDKRIKRLTNELLEGRLTLETFVSSMNTILGTGDKAPIIKPVVKEPSTAGFAGLRVPVGTVDGDRKLPDKGKKPKRALVGMISISAIALVALLIKITLFPSPSAASLPYDHVGLFFDSANSDSPWSDLRVRMAAEYAIEKWELSNIIWIPQGKTSESQHQLIPEGQPGYNSNLPNRDYDISEAGELLDEAGYGGGFETTLYYSSSNADTANEIAEYLSDIGIDTLLVSVDESEIKSAGASSSNNIVLASLSLGSDRYEDLTYYFCSTSEFFPQTARPDGFDDEVVRCGNFINGSMEQEESLQVISNMIYHNVMYLPLCSIVDR